MDGQELEANLAQSAGALAAMQRALDERSSQLAALSQHTDEQEAEIATLRTHAAEHPAAECALTCWLLVSWDLGGLVCCVAQPQPPTCCSSVEARIALPSIIGTHADTRTLPRDFASPSSFLTCCASRDLCTLLETNVPMAQPSSLTPPVAISPMYLSHCLWLYGSTSLEVQLSVGLLWCASPIPSLLTWAAFHAGL